MTLIDLQQFGGEIPRVSDRLLPAHNAMAAVNCDTQGGNLQPIKGTTPVQMVSSTAKTIHKLGESWVHWLNDVSVAPSLVHNSDGRISYTGDSYPKDTNATLGLAGAKRLGIPAPTNALTVTLGGTAGDDILRTSSYCYTIVGKWADGSEVESASSPVTAVFEIMKGQTVTLTGFINSAAAGAFTTHYRIYRLMVGNVGAEFQLVDEILLTKSSYTDSVADVDLGEVLPTENWAAPVENLSGIVSTPHGFMAGFEKNRMYFSESFISYAFPDGYELPTESDVVAIGYNGSSVVAATKGSPYLFIGQDPGTLSPKKLDYKQGVFLPGPLVNVPGGVIYASKDGLFYIDSAGSGRILTERIFKKKQWEALIPANLFAFYFDGSYFAFFEGTDQGIEFTLESNEIHRFTLPEKVYGGCYRVEDDILYLIQENGAVREIVSFRTGSLLDVSWTSKKFAWATDQIFTAGQVQGDFTEGSATVKIYGDGVLLKMATVTDGALFRIKPKRAREVYCTIEGKATVDRILIGSTTKEVFNG